MARLHVLSAWHGPGEEKTARRLAAELPGDWDVIAGRGVPDGRGTVDLDLVVVGRNAVYVCEEKAWGRHVVTGEVAWYVNGERRPSPADQVAHAARVLAGRLRLKIAGWKAAAARLPRGRWAVTGHVVLSHDDLQLDDIGDLGRHVVLRLAETAAVLTGLDEACPPCLADLRPALIGFLLGLPERRQPLPPQQIMQYEVLGKPTRRDDVLIYPARTPAGDPAFLTCVPVDGRPDAELRRRYAVREHDALAALALKNRTWRVQSWFDWEGYRVTPVIAGTDGTSLGKAAATGQPERDESGRVPVAVAAPIVIDAFRAMADVHRLGIVHRGLQLRSVELVKDRIRFRDFTRAHLPTAETVASLLADDDPSVRFGPPGVAAEFFTPADDVYALALCLVQWLHGDAGDQPDHELVARRARAYPVFGSVLARCLVEDPTARPTATQAVEQVAAAVTPGSVRRHEQLAVGELIGGRYRLQRELGKGAWAVTWLALDEVLDEPRTLKLLSPHRAGPELVRAEFTHADKLRSPRCAKAYDMLPRPEPGVLVQEYVEGQSLKDYTASGRRLEREQARQIAVDVLHGLADAHRQAIYHRDVSPGNIIVQEDGRAMLIDFGLSSTAEAAQSAVGSPPFTAPEVWQRRQWSPAADIYSAAASVLFAMLGRHPYAGPGIEERTTLVPPAEADVARYGRTLLDVLYRGVAADPAHRPADAAGFAEQILRARDAEPEPGGPLANPTVDALRGLYRGSTRGNAGNRGLDDTFALDTYRPTRLDSELLPAVLAGELDVVVLSGNPGDGKTSFLVKVGEALEAKGAILIRDNEAGWRRRLDGRTYCAVYDASESHGALSSDALLFGALDADPGDPDDDPAQHTALIAANDGRIAQFVAEHADRYPRLAAVLSGESPADGRTVLVDLKRRALALPDGQMLGVELLDAFTAPPRWQVCDGCAARGICPVRANAQLLRTEPARRAVGELLLISHLRRRRRATVRDVRSALAWLITADLGCEQVHEELAAGADPGAGPRRSLADLAFDPENADYLVREWAEFDPAALPAPAAARAARRDGGLGGGDPSTPRPASTAYLKRALFLGIWGEPELREEVRAYRYLDAYLEALAAPAGALPQLLLGVSRVLSYVGYADPGHLALRERVFDDPEVRAVMVIKELPASEFRLDSTTARAPFVESFPDRLELRHSRSGARLAIPLDTAELLLRAADGEILGDPASAPLRREIEGFGNRLRLQPASSVRVIDDSGRRLRAVVDTAGRIVRETP